MSVPESIPPGGSPSLPAAGATAPEGHHGLEPEFLHSKGDWHIIRERDQLIWLRVLETQAVDGEIVSLAVWPASGSGKWEWEILRMAEDQHVRGGIASSRAAAVEAVEAAALLI